VTRRPLAALLAGAALALGGCDVVGTGSTRAPDCDRADQREHDRDCGYWDVATGRFVPWGWVTPGVDSVPPPGWRPRVPRGGSYVAPPNARVAPTGRVGAGVPPRPGGTVRSPAPRPPTARPRWSDHRPHDEEEPR
jgi:hypothetical protein